MSCLHGVSFDSSSILHWEGYVKDVLSRCWAAVCLEPLWPLVLASDVAVVKVLGCAFSCSHPKFFFFDISSQGLRMTSSQTFVGSLTVSQFVGAAQPVSALVCLIYSQDRRNPSFSWCSSSLVKCLCREKKHTEPVFMGFNGTYRGAWRSCDFRRLFWRMCLCINCYCFRQVRFSFHRTCSSQCPKRQTRKKGKRLVCMLKKKLFMHISSIKNVIGKIGEVVKDLADDSTATEDALWRQI